MEAKIEKVFQEWSDKLNVPVAEFEKEYAEWHSKLKKDRSELTEEQLKIKSLSYLRGKYSRQFQSSAKIFSCYVLGYTTGYDPYKKERDAAIKEGSINEDGRPIFFDARPQMAWRKNQVIPSEDDDSSFQRILYGVFKEQSSEEYKPGIFYLAGRKVNSEMAEPFTEYKVRAGCKAEILNGPVLTLNTAGVTRFEKVGDGVTEFDKMAKAILPNNLAELSKLDAFDVDQAPLSLYITKGSVVNINLTRPEVRSNAIDVAVMADDLNSVSEIDEKGGTNVTFWVHKEIPLNFGVGSEIMVVGQRYMRTDSETGESTPAYNAVGVYVIYNSAPAEKPEQITVENTKAEEEKVDMHGSVDTTPKEVPKEEPAKEAPKPKAESGKTW